MASIFVLLLFLGLPVFYGLHAQDQKLDSLDQLILLAKTDTGKINLKIQKIYILGRSNLDTAIYLGKQLLPQVEKLNFYSAILTLHTQLANNYSYKGNFAAAKENIQFLEKYIKPSDSLNLAILYSSYGMFYGIQSKYDTSITFYKKSIGINERLKNYQPLSGNYGNIAIGYQQLANYSRALEYQQKALTLAETQKDEQLIAKTLLNMALTYIGVGDTVKAINTLFKARDIAVKNEYRIIELYVYTNLSTLYSNGLSWSKTYDYGMKAATLAAKSGDVGIQAASLAKAAIGLANLNKFEEATILSKQSILLADSSGVPSNIAQAYAAMAGTVFLQKKYKDAIIYFEKSLQAINSQPNFDLSFVVTYKNLSESYEKTGDFVKALTNYKLAINMADSLTRKENIRKATELSMNYEFEKKQEILAAEKRRDDELAGTKQLALIIGLLFVVILALIALNGYRNKQKANKLLIHQKQKVESTLSELKSTQAQLIQSEKMASLGELTAGIAHEIQNPLNFVNNFSEVNKELVEELKEELAIGNKQEAIEIADIIKGNEEKINHHGKRADAIVKGMLQHSRQSSGVKEPTNINALCDEYLRLSYHGLRAKDKNFNADFKTEFDESIGKINIVPQDIGRVLLNLINNAFYAVNEKQKLIANGYQPIAKVSTRRLNNVIEIKVSDNGNGIPQNIVDKIFHPFFTTKPTGEGTGLGLSLSYDIIKAHGGKIRVETKEGEGSMFLIYLPITV